MFDVAARCLAALWGGTALAFSVADLGFSEESPCKEFRRKSLHDVSGMSRRVTKHPTLSEAHVEGPPDGQRTPRKSKTFREKCLKPTYT